MKPKELFPIEEIERQMLQVQFACRNWACCHHAVDDSDGDCSQRTFRREIRKFAPQTKKWQMIGQHCQNCGEEMHFEGVINAENL